MNASLTGSLSDADSRWLDHVINASVATAFIAAMTAHAFPFISNSAIYPVRGEPGVMAFLGGFVALATAPSGPYFEAFSLPLVAAFVGLITQRRPGRLGSLVPLMCAIVGLTCLGSAYFWDRSDHLAYGYYVVEACFLIATIASAPRLIRWSRNRAMWGAKAVARFEPAASASQELLSRYRENW